MVHSVVTVEVFSSEIGKVILLPSGMCTAACVLKKTTFSESVVLWWEKIVAGGPRKQQACIGGGKRGAFRIWKYRCKRIFCLRLFDAISGHQFLFVQLVVVGADE